MKMEVGLISTKCVILIKPTNTTSMKTPMPEKVEIPLTRGYVAIIDSCDLEKVSGYKWYAYKGYATMYAGRSVMIDGKKVRIPMHRLLMDAPKGFDVDHIDHDGLNNTRDNLRLATRSQNSFNRPMNKNNKTGIRCIYWYKQTNRWVLKMAGKTIGYFKELPDAVDAYNLKAKELWGDFAPQQKYENKITQ